MYQPRAGTLDWPAFEKTSVSRCTLQRHHKLYYRGTTSRDWFPHHVWRLFYFYRKKEGPKKGAMDRALQFGISESFKAMRLIIKMQKVRIIDRGWHCLPSSLPRWSWSNRLRQSIHFKGESGLKNLWKGCKMLREWVIRGAFCLQIWRTLLKAVFTLLVV